jgi:hypothetical protein
MARLATTRRTATAEMIVFITLSSVQHRKRSKFCAIGPLFQLEPLLLCDIVNRDRVLPSDYTDKAKEVAEHEIVLSGYRMSEAMVDVFGQ